MPCEKLTIAYLRLSKEDGDVETGTAEESCSIGSQRTCINRYLHGQGFDESSFQEIIDDGYSGTNMNRPGMNRLLRLVRDGRVRAIIVRDLSRFARNYLEAGHYLEFVFPAYGVRFLSINDQFDSERLGETTGGLELAIKNLINQMYSKDISRKIKSAVDLKKLSGEYVYGTAPYGYRKGEQKNTIVVDEPAAMVVRQIFQWAAEGITITHIARQLNQNGTITPSVYLSAVRGKYKTYHQWSYESVRNILANRIYTGDTVPFKSHVVRVGSDNVKQIPAEFQQIIPGTHEGIISRELFYQARTVIKSTKKSKKAAPPNPFTSLLVCSCCGKRLSKGKPQNKNWTCTTHRYVPESTCQHVRINESKLTEIVLHAITMQCQLLDEKLQRIEEEHHVIKSREQLLQGECRTLRRQIDRLQTDKMQFYEDYVSDILCKDDFLAKKHQTANQEEVWKAQLQFLEKELDSLAHQKKTSQLQVDNGKKLVQYQELKELTPELTKELIKQIIVFPDGSIRIEWNFRDELASLIDFSQIATKSQAV